MTFEQFEEFLLTEECFMEHDVSIINDLGEQHYILSDDYWEYQITMALHISQFVNTIKVEQMEKRYDWSDRTIHFFYNPVNGPTFDAHTDPIDVIIDCHDGVKHMEVDGKTIEIRPGGNKLLIRANTPHKALNYEKALMASHGINDTETLSNIRQDDRDL